MLQHLFISNYALIENIDIDFSKGFTAITGQTGAGKSIILGALGLIMGAKANPENVRRGAAKAIIEATFKIDDPKINDMLRTLDIDPEEQLIVRREITAAGRSRAFVNDTPAALTDLRSLSCWLIDIHSQHQNMLFADADFQLNLVDTIAQNSNRLETYDSIYKQYTALTAEIERLKEKIETNARERDYDNFQFQQLADACLKEGEQNELETELKILQNSQEIIRQTSTVDSLLNDSDAGAAAALRTAVNAMKHIMLLPGCSELYSRLESAYFEINDIGQEVQQTLESLQFDPRRQDIVESRLDTLYSLEHKHHVDSDAELIALRDNLEKKLSYSADDEARVEKLTQQVAALRNELTEAASALSKSRVEVCPQISDYIAEHLKYLGINNAKIEAVCTPTERFTPKGNDAVQILFSANKNQSLRPIAEIASGGEISRLMLVIKQLIAAKRCLPTIIFDEIDTGISGIVSSRVADTLFQMSSDIQLIAITHQPQIAAAAAEHLKVFKRDNDESTITQIVRLTPDERIDELAEIISGNAQSEAARQTARDLLKQAQNN